MTREHKGGAMQLKIEIKNEKFLYSYKHENGNFSSSEPISPESLLAFSHILNRLNSLWDMEFNLKKGKFEAKLWAENNGYTMVKDEDEI